jgi:hypothetical protein
VAACGNVPWQLMQGAFHMLRPTLSLAKAVALIDRAENDEFLNGFLALETWGNDNVSFPGAAFEDYIEKLYRKDLLIKGEFSMSGKTIRLEDIKVPTLSVVFEHDNIVPWESASVLIDKVSSTDKALWKLPGGHVGAVVSKTAQKKLWPQLSNWWAQREDGRPVVTVQGETVKEETVRVAQGALPVRVADPERSAAEAEQAEQAEQAEVEESDAGELAAGNPPKRAVAPSDPPTRFVKPDGVNALVRTNGAHHAAHANGVKPKTVPKKKKKIEAGR